MISTENMVNGIMRYADREIINQLPTIGKWVVGTGIGIVGKKANELAHVLENNQMIKVLGIVDEDGKWNAELLKDEMLQNAQKYGKATVEVPVIGKFTFSENDIQKLFKYIKGEM